MKSIPLRWLIITPFVMLALISGVVMYWVSTVTISNIVQSVGLHYIQEVEKRVHDRVQTFTAPLTTIVDINRHAFSNQPELLDDLLPLSTRFYEQAFTHSQMTFISVATPDGRYIAASRDAIGKVGQNIAANFVNEALTMEGFEYDPKAFVGPKIESLPTFEYDPRVRPFYIDAVAAKGGVWSNIHPYYGQPILGIGFSKPIYDQQGEFIGVTATSIALLELNHYLETLPLVDNAYIFVAEPSGELVATSLQDELYHVENDVYTRVTLATHQEKLFHLANQNLEIGTHNLTIEGEHYLYYVTPIELNYGKTWVTGILIPAAYHKEALSEYTQTAIFITLTLFASIALVGAAIAWYIGKPIQLLNQAANDKKIESIQTLKQPLSRIKEVNSLSQGLHSMADNLLDILQNLEQKVSERTSHLQDENDNLQEEALTDELTKLYNRRGFKQVYEQTLQLANQKNLQVAVVLGDIDHFKVINDKFGHSAGDAALVSVATILKKHTRSSMDIVARYGGEEFILVFLGMDHAQTIQRLSSIQKEFSSKAIIEKHYITMSFGLVHVEDLTSIKPEELIEQADKKLYRAKASGRNRIIS